MKDLDAWMPIEEALLWKKLKSNLEIKYLEMAYRNYSKPIEENESIKADKEDKKQNRIS